MSSDPTWLRRPLEGALVASQVLSTEGGTSMSGARQNSNLAARMGRWSAAHWKTATFGWLALVSGAPATHTRREVGVLSCARHARSSFGRQHLRRYERVARRSSEPGRIRARTSR